MKKCCIGGLALIIVAPPTVGTLPRVHYSFDVIPRATKVDQILEKNSPLLQILIPGYQKCAQIFFQVDPMKKYKPLPQTPCFCSAKSANFIKLLKFKYFPNGYQSASLVIVNASDDTF